MADRKQHRHEGRDKSSLVHSLNVLKCDGHRSRWLTGSPDRSPCVDRDVMAQPCECLSRSALRQAVRGSERAHSSTRTTSAWSSGHWLALKASWEVVMSAGRPIPIGSTFQVQALLYSESQGSVVVAPLQKFDPIRLDEIDAAVLPADATRPDAKIGRAHV